MFSVGDRVGDYELVAKLKAGGMATLFVARRAGVEGFSRHVAIKLVHEHLANDSSFVRMFVDEALLSAKIHHPNVVHVEELGEQHGRHYLVMEYVHGCSLSTLMNALRARKRTPGPDLACFIAVAVLEGLHAAHEATGADGQPLGVVHRDVSPQNVLLAYRGHVKLIDFGVAKAAGRAQQTTGASLKGKIGYMSPEQAFGRPVDRRTDVYALGIVLWEMLTGRKAFVADNDFALLELVRDPKLPPPSAINPAVPPALDAVIAKAVAKNADDRFQTALQMRKAIAQAMPSALALDASDLERLMAATLGGQMAEERQALPESLSGLAPIPIDVDVEEVVHTMTVSAATFAPPDPQPAVTPHGTVILPDSSQPRPAPDAPRSRVGLWISAIAACLLIGFGAVAGGLYVFAPRPQMRATQLRDPVEPASAPPAAQPAVEEPTVVEEPVQPVIAQPEVVHAPAPIAPQEAPVAQEGPARRPRPRPRPAARSRPTNVGGVPMMNEF